MTQVKASPHLARLITVNHEGKSYDIVPGGAGSVAVDMPSAAAKSAFVKALVEAGDLIVGESSDDEVETGDKLLSLRKEAQALGIKFDGRTTEDSLQKKIDEAKAPK